MFKIRYNIIFLQFSTYLIATRGEFLRGPCAESIKAYINSILQIYPGIILPPFNYNCMQDGDDVINMRYPSDIRLPSEGAQSHHAFSTAGSDRIISQSGQGVATNVGTKVGGLATANQALKRELEVSHQSGNKRLEYMTALSENTANKMHVKKMFENGISHHNQFGNQAGLTNAHQENSNRLLGQMMDDRQNNFGVYSGITGGPRPIEFPMTRPMRAYEKNIGFADQNHILNQGVQQNHFSNTVGVADNILFPNREEGDHVRKQLVGGYSTGTTTYQEKMRLQQQNEIKKEQTRQQQEKALKALEYYLQGGTLKKETAVSNLEANHIREFGMKNTVHGGSNDASQIYQSFGGQNVGLNMNHDQAADEIEIITTGEDRGLMKGGQKVLISTCPDGSDLCITIDT